jgi:CheY-like chemotaxis protein
VEKLRVLLVEDSQTDIDACFGTVKRYKLQKKIDIDCVSVKTKDEALAVLDSSFDGAIVDIKLDQAGTEGNDIISEIHKETRIPIAVFTGTPENVTEECPFIGSYKKGETGYDEIFDNILEVYSTGLTKILGGRGVLDEAMRKIFWDHLLPQFDTWKNYQSAGNDTERGILRTVLNHLLELLDNDDNPAVPEEMYIIPPLASGVKTGSIVSRSSDGKRFIVISPPCDLVVRTGGTFKTDKILISEIDDFEQIKENMIKEIASDKKKIKKLSELLQNKHTEYYHWLAGTTLFTPGVINFRWTHSVDKDSFGEEYGVPIAQLSAPFIKDVISRFSAFYARQGQPDFNFSFLAEELI